MRMKVMKWHRENDEEFSGAQPGFSFWWGMRRGRHRTGWRMGRDNAPYSRLGLWVTRYLPLRGWGRAPIGKEFGTF